MEEAIVLYPSPAIGHLISLVELGKIILSHRPDLAIHVLLPTAPYAASSTAHYISAVSTAVPSIKFHHLPTISLPSTTATHHETLTIEVLRLSKPHVHQSLLSISKAQTVKALILDLFCACVLSVTSQLNIPAYYYFTSNAAILSVIFYFPTLHAQTDKSFKELDKTLLDVPGLPPIPARDLPKPLLDREDVAYQFFLDCYASLPRSSGVIVNTFEVLEANAVKAIRDGICTPCNTTPPLYCIGPLVATKDLGSEAVVPECLSWLDLQPSNSVLFLCFGGMGLFSREQLSEIAIGLENSRQRFLWVVRSPPSDDKTVAISGQTKPEDLESLLPQGFLDRTKERGLVVKSWAPHVAVLNHDSVGGFVTHCGWNSVLEAVCAGVPMVAWPLYAEQRFHRVMLVEEMKIAIPMVESEVDGFVGWAEVEKRVRELMDSDEGQSLRERTFRMREAAKAALREGGSSHVDLDKFLDSW